MLDSLVPIDDDSDTDPDSSMEFSDPPSAPANPFLQNQDPLEAALEAQEAHKYLLAKSYFDTREYDRCAAVFLPPMIPPVPLSSVSPNPKASRPSLTPQKDKTKTSPFGGPKNSTTTRNPYPRLSQKSLFLALYAKYLAGEKRKDEETEMVLGPADGGMTVNKELPDLARGLEGWFAERRENGLENRGQGWLEYLYGVILLKGKNEEEAKKWLIRSVHLNPFHWGAWQELNDLLANTEDVCFRRGCDRRSTADGLTVETSSRRAPSKHYDPYFPLLLQPRAISSYGGYSSDIKRTRNHLSQQRVPQDTESTALLPFERCVPISRLIHVSSL